MRLIAIAAGLMIGLALAVPKHHARAEDNGDGVWKSISCGQSPISVDIQANEDCRRGPDTTETRGSCYTRQYINIGRTATGFYLVYLHRLETGPCYMSSITDTDLERTLKSLNPQTTDWGETRRLGDSYVKDFKFEQKSCFGFANQGGTAGFTGAGVRLVVIGQFCAQDAAGYDDVAKRGLIAGVKIAP